MTGDRINVSLIEGKVAKLLNDRELVINRGSDHGIEPDMIFKVIDENENVIDPDTHTSLGSIEREKLRIKIVHVQPSLSVGRTFETYTTPSRAKIDLFSSPVGNMYDSSTQVRTVRSSGAIDESGASISIGDKVVQVED